MESDTFLVVIDSVSGERYHVAAVMRSECPDSKEEGYDVEISDGVSGVLQPDVGKDEFKLCLRGPLALEEDCILEIMAIEQNTAFRIGLISNNHKSISLLADVEIAGRVGGYVRILDIK